MAISLLHTDASTVYSASATSVNVPINASVETGDLIVISYMTRSAVTVPAGFAKHAEGNQINVITQYQGFLVKVSDGTEGGTNVTVAQASAGRIEAFHCIFRASGALSVSQSAITDGGTSASFTMASLTEATAFAAVSLAASPYSFSTGIVGFDIDAASDAEWLRTNSVAPSDGNANRIWGAYALYIAADSTNLVWVNNNNTKDSSASIITILEDVAPDVTAPTLTSPSGTQTGPTTADLSVSTDEGNGTLYWVVSTSSTPPSVAQIQAGNDSAGSAAADGGNQAVSSTGTQNASGTGLTASSTYYPHFQHKDAAGNDGTVSTGPSFTTAAAVIKGIQLSLKQADGTTDAASLTGLYYHIWDALNPGGASDTNGSTETTDASGVLEININSFTASIGGEVFLFVYDLDGTEDKDSVCFAGRVPVVDIS